MTPKVFGSLLLAAALVAGTAPALAGDRALSEKDVKKRLNKAEDHLQEAREASQRGDTDAALAHVDEYTQSLDQVNAALDNGQVREDDLLDVAERVDEATLKHMPVLQDVYNRVPAQAQPAIERAMQVSVIGHNVATQALLEGGAASFPRGVLDYEAARDIMKQNSELLEHAKRARQWGDKAALEASVSQYAANIGAVTRAIEVGALDHLDPVGVLQRVDRHTRHHLGILEDLHAQVPAEAQPAIARAIQVSQRGNQAAVQAVGRSPAGGIGAGRPGSVGRPGGVGGPGGGGIPAGGPGGAPSGGGPPSGGPGGPPR